MWFFTRAGYSGRPGSAAYEMGNFPGDETVDWGAGSGLRSLAPDMLNRAVGGAFGYTTDIGGYGDLLTGAAERGAVQSLDGVGSAHALLPRPQLRRERDAHAMVLRPRHARALEGDGRAPRQRHSLHASPVAARPSHGDADHAAAVARSRRGARGGDRSAGVAARSDVLVAPVVEEGRYGASGELSPWLLEQQAARGRESTGRARPVSAPLGVLPYFFRCGSRPFAAK